VRDALDEKLGPLLPVLEAIAKERGIELTQLVLPKP
jgi:riboflavin synthase